MSAAYSSEGVTAEPARECTLCGAPGRLLYEGLRDRLFGAPGAWGIRRCSRCGLIWLDPRPSREGLANLYNRYYTHGDTRRSRRWTTRLEAWLRRGLLASCFGYKAAAGGVSATVARVLGWLSPLRDWAGSSVMWLPSGRRGRLLDVGSGNGEFLATMRDLGWEVVGLEPDYAAAAAARRDHGLDVILGTLEGATLDEASFDAVTLSHVIEHVPDPVQTIRECYRLLRRGGVLVVLTPNIASLCHRVFGADWRGLEPPRHLFLFSPETMRRCASAAGFSAVRIRTPARGTPYAWGMSRLLRTRRVSDGLSGRGLSSWGRVVALAMWLVEAGGVRLGVRWGEEVLIEAVKE